MTSLLSVSEALQRLLAAFQPVKGTGVPLQAATGRVLFRDIYSTLDLPSFNNSGMDGFAVRSADTQSANSESPVSLQIVEEIPAGYVPLVTLKSGQAARIMTGAMLPAGADGVIPVEDTRQPDLTLPEQSSDILILRSIRAGEYVRPKGQDVSKGSKVLEKGKRLLPQDIGLLASLGIERVPVFRRPRVALVSTGDELVPPGVALAPGKIHDSNSYMLAALIRQTGCQPIRLGVAADTYETVQSILTQAVSLKVDLLLTSAGVSVGKYDFIRTLIEAEGHLDFWRVNMRPGKPFTFGSYKNTPVIGLPGNPVSAFVGFEVFVRPILALLGGASASNRQLLHAELAEPISSDGRESYLRATVEYQDGRLVAHLAGHQGSGNLVSLVQANALLIVPSGVKSLPIGAQISIILMGG